MALGSAEALALERPPEGLGAAVADQHRVRDIDREDALALGVARQVTAKALHIGELGHQSGRRWRSSSISPAGAGGARAQARACRRRSAPGAALARLQTTGRPVRARA